MRIRTLWLVSAAGSLFLYPALPAEDVSAVWTGTEVRIAAARIGFLSGKPLERLRSGNTVQFDFQLAALAAPAMTPLKRTLERFAVSYDLWEEKFSVAQLIRPKTPRRGGRGLGPRETEAWCLEHTALPTEGLAADRPLYLHLDVQAVEPRESAAPWTDPQVTLTKLIDLFSRPARPHEARHSVRLGPVRLAGLRR